MRMILSSQLRAGLISITFVCFNETDSGPGLRQFGSRVRTDSFGTQTMRRDAETSDNGTVSIEIRDTDIAVGSRYCMTMIYTAGRQGVSVGGSLRFKLPGLNLKGSNTGPVSCSNLQVKLKCSNRLPEVNGKNGSEFFTIDYLFVTIQGEPLKEGDTISVRYGASIGLKHMRAPEMAQNRLG